MSGVPSPRVRKPKPRSRLNHFTIARSSPLVGVTVTWVRAGGSVEGWIAVDSSIDRMRKHCIALRPLQHLGDHARAFIGGLEAVAAQAGHVQENVRAAIVRHDESIALGDIEPLDDAGELDDGRRLVGDIADLLRSKPQSLLENSSDAMTTRLPLNFVS